MSYILIGRQGGNLELTGPENDPLIHQPTIHPALLECVFYKEKVTEISIIIAVMSSYALGIHVLVVLESSCMC